MDFWFNYINREREREENERERERKREQVREREREEREEREFQRERLILRGKFKILQFYYCIINLVVNELIHLK